MFAEMDLKIKIVVPIPVHGRLLLLAITIRRLYEVNGVHKVVCVGDDPKARRICEDLGAEWVECDNRKLGRKWNAGFKACQKYDPDGVLFAGSSDWISENYLPDAIPYLDKYAMIGKLGCHFADVASSGIRVVRWDGYGEGQRAKEPIGIGRLLSKSILDKIGWKPFEDHLNSSLDWSMYCKVVNNDGRIGLFESDEYRFLSISTDKWPNKHIFEDHWSGKIPSTRIRKDEILQQFPELLEL